MVQQAVLLQPMEVRAGAEIYVQSMQDSRLDVSGGRCSMWRPHAGADFVVGAAAQNSCWNSLLLKDCAQWEGASLEQFMKDYILWKGLQGNSVRRKEWQGGAVMG